MKGVKRVSISLPDETFEHLEEMISKKNWNNRSQAITQLVRDAHLEVSSEDNDSVMAGSITLFYEETQREVFNNVAQIQRNNVEEVISANRVLLENNHIMEILVVQGQVKKLLQIQQQFLNVKGVESGKLVLTNLILPPVHSK